MEAENKRIADDNRKIIQEISIPSSLLGSQLPPDWEAMFINHERMSLLQTHQDELYHRHATFQPGDASFARLHRDHEALVATHRKLVARNAILENDFQHLSQQPVSWLNVSDVVVDTLFFWVIHLLTADPPTPAGDLCRW